MNSGGFNCSPLCFVLYCFSYFTFINRHKTLFIQTSIYTETVQWFSNTGRDRVCDKLKESNLQLCKIHSQQLKKNTKEISPIWFAIHRFHATGLFYEKPAIKIAHVMYLNLHIDSNYPCKGTIF